MVCGFHSAALFSAEKGIMAEVHLAGLVSVIHCPEIAHCALGIEQIHRVGRCIGFQIGPEVIRIAAEYRDEIVSREILSRPARNRKKWRLDAGLDCDSA